MDNEDLEGQEVIKSQFRKLHKEPTQDDIDEHNIDHSVFRSWCPHFVHGKNRFPDSIDKRQNFGHPRHQHGLRLRE